MRRLAPPTAPLLLAALLTPALASSAAPAVAPPSVGGPASGFDAVAEAYVDAWIAFYPSRALGRGLLRGAEGIEDRSAAAIDAWIRYNREAEAQLDATLAAGAAPGSHSGSTGSSTAMTRDERIDARLLRRQIHGELERWQRQRPHRVSLAVYAEPIADALPAVLETPRLSAEARLRCVRSRLAGIVALAAAATENLEDGRTEEVRRGLEALDVAAERLEAGPPETLGAWLGATDAEALDMAGKRAAAAVRRLAAWVRADLVPRLTLPDAPILGRDAYARRLAIYADRDLTPEALADLARREMEAARAAIADTARAWWRAERPGAPLPADEAELVAAAFDAVEADRPESEEEYLGVLRGYAERVEAFVREHPIATLPENQTLSIELAPESAGPMARVGFVRAAPPFDPNPWTTWYLATIPDSHPESERVDFWRSFNYPFKRFIVIHELFPGHYLQMKLLRESPRPVRILFPYNPFIEGWATFAERVVLDAGYLEGDRLARLAQLRKRLENANRAYTSVQAHCDGWSEEEVVRFSIDSSLLAPQFAKSLWNRLMNWPMQMTTYMLGGIELREIRDAERRRLGDAFDTRDFMDTVLRTGPVPSDEIAALLGARRPPGDRHQPHFDSRPIAGGLH